MPTSTMKKDIYRMFDEAVAPAKLDDTGKDMRDQIYAITLARFERKARKQGKEVWDVAKFVKFVRMELAKIAKAAKAAANRQDEITGKVLTTVSRKSMQATHKHCHMRLNTDGDIVGFTYEKAKPMKRGQVQMIGDICSTYLESEL